jgi:hypothetical protein
MSAPRALLVSPGGGVVAVVAGVELTSPPGQRDASTLLSCVKKVAQFDLEDASL